MQQVLEVEKILRLTIATAPGLNRLVIITRRKMKEKVRSHRFGANYIKVGTKTIIWDANTIVKINDADVIKARHGSSMEGTLLDRSTKTVLASKLEIN